MSSAETALSLGSEEREVALAESQAVLAVAGDPGYRDQLAVLLGAIDEGVIGTEEAQVLEGVLELALQSGRVRALYGPGGEQAALRLYRRLPRGSELRASAAAVTDALAGLAGRRLESVAVEATGPGAFQLKLVVEGADVSLRLDRQGARLTSVGV
jgi:hypothetical protein